LPSVVLNFGCWRPTKQNKTQLADLYVSKILLYYWFCRPKNTVVATYRLRNTVWHAGVTFWLQMYSMLVKTFQFTQYWEPQFYSESSKLRLLMSFLIKRNFTSTKFGKFLSGKSNFFKHVDTFVSEQVYDAIKIYSSSIFARLQDKFTFTMKSF
jgi:hypothetical protein